MESGMVSREKGSGIELEYVTNLVDFQSRSGIRGGLRTLVVRQK